MAVIFGDCSDSLLRFAHLLYPRLPHNVHSCLRQVEYLDAGDDADGGHTAEQYHDAEAAAYAR